MKIYLSIIILVIFLVNSAYAQSPPIPECPIESNVITVLSKLNMDIIFGEVEFDKDLQNKFKTAAYSDMESCQNVANGMHNWIEEAIRIKEENNRLLQEITNLKLENALLKSKLDEYN